MGVVGVGVDSLDGILVVTVGFKLQTAIIGIRYDTKIRMDARQNAWDFHRDLFCIG